MSGLSLELFKKHVRADDFADDDDLLSFYLETAEEMVVRYTHRTAEELMAGSGELPRPLQQAAMMLAAHWYNQRESVSAVQMHSVPGAVQTLLKPFRRLAPDNNGNNDESYAGGTYEGHA